MTAVYIFAALAVVVLAAYVLTRRAVPFDSGLRVGVVAHLVDNTTVPMIRALFPPGVTPQVRVDRYAGGVNDASVQRALAEGFEVVVVDMGGDYREKAGSTTSILIQDGNESDAKGIAAGFVMPGVGISSGVTDAWLATYIKRYRNSGAFPLCIHAYGQPAATAIRNAVARAKRVLDAANKSLVPIWVTECGVSSSGPCQGTAQDLTNALYALAADPRIARAFVYALVDDAEHYGLYVNGQPTAYADAVRTFNHRSLCMDGSADAAT